MTQVPPSPAPAAPAAPAPPTPTSFADGPVADAARARLEAEFGTPNQPGTPVEALTAPPAAPGAPAVPAAAPEAPPVDFFSDEGIDALVRDDMPYRDAVRLRDEIKKARDTYKPFRDAFAQMDDQGRQALLTAAPNLGPDLGLLANIASVLDENDRGYFIEAMSYLAQNTPEATAKGAKMLADGAAQLRSLPGVAAFETAPPVDPAMAWANPDPNAPPAAAPVPMTRDEVAAEFDRRDRERDQRDEQTRIQGQILAEARTLGYDPDAQRGTAEYDRFTYLITLAGQQGGGIAEAHKRVEAQDQAIIDRFVAGKSADAGRPGAPAVAGTPPVETRTLETMPDAQQAALARLDAALGPDPRRRAAEE